MKRYKNQKFEAWAVVLFCCLWVMAMYKGCSNENNKKPLNNKVACVSKIYTGKER